MNDAEHKWSTIVDWVARGPADVCPRCGDQRVTFCAVSVGADGADELGSRARCLRCSGPL